ncbi:MAG TPA: immunoglobulin domain-containing protein [Anaerohalosphaeraceae bacterium]|nr:immunoglobulin domain-containing protein [Anaerohalosphaeraceae bacterium]
MTRIFCILSCLCIASTAFPLSITNGDFENQFDVPYNKDILYWYDYGGPSIAVDQGPFFLGQITSSIFGSKCVYMGKEANTNQDGGNHTYVYQSIGFYDGNPPVVEVELDWGLAPGRVGGPMGVTVMILESDGTFVPSEWEGQAGEIYGKPGIREIGRGTIVRTTATGVVFHERFQIDLRSTVVGRELFLRFNNYKVGALVPYVQIDNITLSPSSVVNKAPQEGALYIPVWRTESGNDLVFEIVDPEITSVDVLFGPENDPNLSTKPQYKIVQNRPVSMGLNTVTLESELAQDLNWETNYYWKVLAYKSDGMGGRTLKYTGHISSFKTIQRGPYLTAVSPDVLGVWPGSSAVFTVPFSVSADTFQWYKQGNPNPLVNGSKYSGADSNSLTIFNVQRADEGTYYCVGRETATGLTSSTLAPGVLFIKELKSYYPFETTYTVGSNVYTPDVIGGKDAKLVGGASVVVSPSDPNNLFGGYLALRNPRNVTHTQYAEISDTSVVHYPELTISCWVKPELLDLDYERNARIFDFGQDSQNYFFLTLLRNTNQPYCEMKLNNSSRDTAATGDIGYGTKWLYVVLTVADGLDQDGQTATLGKIYINGQYGGGEGLYHPNEISKMYNYIGKAIDQTGTPPNFNGLIDELKIYNYAKTAEEIAREYMAVRTDVESICNMESYDLADWDYNSNCRIDLPDLAEIAERWLDNYLVYFD